MKTLLVLLISSLMLTAACGDTTEDAPIASETLVFDDAKADSSGELRVRADGMTIWADQQVQFFERGDLFVLSARSSYNLDAVSASIAEQAVDARTVSARKFEISMTTDDLYRNLAEEPLVIRLETDSGKTFHAMFVARARFRNTSGSYKIYPWKNINPIYIGDQLHFRGRITTRGVMQAAYGLNDDDSEPSTWREDDTHWVFDFLGERILWAAAPTADALEIVVDDADGNRYRKDAPIYMDIIEMGVTNGDPDAVWAAPGCHDEVAECVADLPVSLETDYEQCGSAREVKPCLPDFRSEQLTETILRNFADGIRGDIFRLFREQRADIEAASGASQPEALVAVDTSVMQEITEPEEDPTGSNLDEVRVFTHPDTVFVGSDIVWIGVFDRQNGELLTIERFN